MAIEAKGKRALLAEYVRVCAHLGDLKTGAPPLISAPRLLLNQNLQQQQLGRFARQTAMYMDVYAYT